MSNDKVLGSWTLEAYQFIDGDGAVTYPMGDDAFGMIIYAADGHMCANLMEGNRPKYVGKDRINATADEKVQAHDSHLSYCGTWKIEGGQAVHTVTGSSFPNFIGHKLVRDMTWEGDDILILTTPPVKEGDQVATAKLRWRRASAG